MDYDLTTNTMLQFFFYTLALKNVLHNGLFQGAWMGWINFILFIFCRWVI